MPNWKRIVVSGSDATLNTLTVSNGITGSLQGTASFATQALSASFAPSTPAFPFTGSAIITGSLNVIGNTTITGSIRISSPTSSISTLTLINSGSVANPAGAPLLMFSSSATSNYLINSEGGAFYVTTKGSGFSSRSELFVGGVQLHNAAGTPSVASSGIMNITSTNQMNFLGAGSHRFFYAVYIGAGTAPTAMLHLIAGTAAASTAPLKLTSGTNLTTPEAGAIEFNGTNLFFTTGSTRSTILTNINPAGITGSISIFGGTDGSNSTFIGTSGVVIGKGKIPTLENIFIGSGSANTSITTGTQNYCFGVGSGNGITSGIYNVLMGPSAGSSINSGGSNVFIGRTTGYRTTTGVSNIALGNTTLYYNTTTSDNIAIGTSALQGSNANTGARNIGIGSEAGYAILTGNNNVYVGYRAGRFISDGVTDALVVSASIFIGAETRPLSSSQTNQIVIGHEAIGLGSNTVVIGNNSITTTSLKGNTQVSGSLNISGSTTLKGNTIITGSLLVSGSSIIAGFNPTPLEGTIQDGVTSVLGNLNDWNSNYYQGTVLYSETAGGTITFGQLCYRTQNETWELADATAASAAAAFNMLGICVKSSTATNPTSILINGFVETAAYAAILKSGEPLYMATTAGSMTKTAPTTVGNAVRIIGNTFWDSNTNTKIIIRFNPENSWIEL